MNKEDNPAKEPTKDIVYIDVEDDVTSVISKVRGSDQKIVALVPPKNIGALQSAVNLRLLQKAADNAGKRIVLITNNSGLTALAAGVKLPVARNLQSKPEIPAAPGSSADVDEDIIKGEDLPIGELAAASAVTSEGPGVVPAALKASDDDITINDSELPDLSAPVASGTAAAAVAKKKGGPRVPNFNRFRKWIFIGGGVLAAIVLFFVLTNLFWTGANVVITAQTSDEPIDLALTLSTTASTSPDSGVLHAETKTLKKTASADFTATGKKNVGEKATGTVKFSTNNISNLGTTIPAGTELTSSGGSVYLTDQAVTISFTNYQGANTGVTAKIQGASSNGASGNLDGAPSGISATLAAATAGGTDKTATVVSGEDIAGAIAKLSASDAASAKNELTGQFGKDYVIIGDSFNAANADPVGSPSVGSEGSAGKVTRDSTYTLTAIKKSEIKTVSTDALNFGIKGGNQRIYDDGASGATISQFATSPAGVQTAHVKTTGKIGPNIDDAALKNQIAGKKSGEINGLIMANEGVKDVTVSFAPFWRSTAPSADKIKISFDLQT